MNAGDFSFRYLAPPFEGVPYADNERLVGANLVSQTFVVEGTGWFFEELTENGLWNLGSVIQLDQNQDGTNESYITTWDPARLEFPFPLTYGTTWSHTSVQTSQIENNPPFSPSSQEEVSEVDGWGSLVLPEGTFPCIRFTKISTTKIGEVVLTETSFTNFFTPLAPVGGKSSGISVAYWVTMVGGASGIGEVNYTRIVAGGTATANEDVSEIPQRSRLDQNYPNPFNPTTTIPFALDEPGHARLVIYDNLGQKVATILDRTLPVGAHHATWAPQANVPSGVYFARLSVNGQSTRRTLVFQK